MGDTLTEPNIVTATKPDAPHHLQIKYRPLAELTLNPRNPRRHDRAQLRKLAKSIRTFGFIVPVVIDARSQVIAGHGRCLAAKDLGQTSVPTILVEHLSDAQIHAFNVADNRLTDISIWDDKLLGEQLKYLSELELDFDLEATAFDMAEIDFKILENSQPTDQPEAETLPPLGPAVTRAGDLWELGAHRVYCENALESDSFTKLMGDQKAAMVFSDPPYNVPIDGFVSGLGAVRHREFPMGCGEMDPQQFTEFLSRSFALYARHSVDGALHFHCMDWRHCGEMTAAGKSVYTELKALCIWKKQPGMGSLFRNAHELIFVYKNGRAPHRNNIKLGKYGRHRSNVWEYPSANAFGRTSEEGPLFERHPTVKPIRLVADAVLDASARGELVLDGFLGSGTTLVAAERTGRVCYGLEIDPLYVDLIVRRWQAYTGETARNARTHDTFDAPQLGLGKCKMRTTTSSDTVGHRSRRNSKKVSQEIKRADQKGRKV